jgi:hypothetical protein
MRRFPPIANEYVDQPGLCMPRGIFVFPGFRAQTTQQQ